MQFIDLAAQYRHLQPKIDARIKAVLEHGQYIMGPEVQELEARLAEYVGVKHAVTCANGTDALTLAMMVLDIGEGDAVFCPTFTFFATAETVAFAGARPVFVDSDFLTFNLCPLSLEIQIKRVLEEGLFRPKAIIAVDLFGLPADYPELRKIADKYGLYLIEDAAQGFGGEIGDFRAGSFGDVATTSFFPAKPLGCYGDGGAIFTNNDEFACLLKSLRVHGKGVDKYDNVRIGINSRLDTIQAAILIEKLCAFPIELEARRLAASRYSSKLGRDFLLPHVPEGFESSWAQYTVRSEFREEAIARFQSEGVPTAIYYERCLHLQPAFASLGYTQGSFPVAETMSRQVFSLPMHGYLDQ